jgi:hypothetical protein
MSTKTNKVVCGFTIEKKIEVTPNTAGGVKGRWAKICAAMEAGDSVLVANSGERVSLASRINALQGYKAVTRKEGDKIRVWKCVGENKTQNFIQD